MNNSKSNNNNNNGASKYVISHSAMPSFWSIKNIRTQIAILLAAALCIEGLMRTNLNMAMVCMVNRTALLQLKS